MKQLKNKWHPDSIKSGLIPSKSKMQILGITLTAYAMGDSIKNNSAEIQKYKNEYVRLYNEAKNLKNNLRAFVDTAFKCQYLREVYEKAEGIGSAAPKDNKETK